MPAPRALRVCERPRVAGVAPEDDGIDEEERQCRRQPPRLPARHEQERRHERETRRPRQNGETDGDACPPEAPALRERERREREKEEQRLRVDGLEEERRR